MPHFSSLLVIDLLAKSIATRVIKEPLVIWEYNIEHATANVKSWSSRAAAKKGGKSLGARKALKDTTNKSSIPAEVLSMKNLPEEEFNIAEEMFLHDHNKCIEERKAALNDFDLNLVFPDEEEQWKLSEGIPEVDFDNFHCYLEPTELPIPSFSDLLGPSCWLISPPSSPLNHDTSMDSDFFWKSNLF